MTRPVHMTLLTLTLAAAAWASASAQTLPATAEQHGISIRVSSPQELAQTGEWVQASDDVWQREIDGVQAELAFGEAALERSLDHVEVQIERLGSPNSRQQELRLLELELRRDELLELARKLLARTTDTSQQQVCGGWATFTHFYGDVWFFAPGVRSRSAYAEPGPVSPYTKTTYASARACSSSGSGHCHEPPPDSDSTTGYSVSSEVQASIRPASGAAREAFGYVLVSGWGCNDIKSFATSVPH